MITSTLSAFAFVGRRIFLGSLLSLATILAVGCAVPTEDEDSDSDTGAYTASRPRAGDETLPATLEINGFKIGAFEYWPYKEEAPIFPSKVKRGFDSGSDPARACLAKATRQLAEILRTPPTSLVRLREEQGVWTFLASNSDFFDAPRSAKVEEMTQRALHGRALLRWVSITNRDGTCTIPKSADLERFATRCLETYPDCS